MDAELLIHQGGRVAVVEDHEDVAIRQHTTGKDP